MGVRRIILTCAVLWVALLAGAVPAWSQSHAPAPAAPGHDQPAAQHGGDVKEGAVAEGHTAEGEHDEGLLPTVFRIANFAILVGILVYFLRAPLAAYLSSRSEQIRADLVQAADMRRSAEAQLAEIDARLAALPGELAALRARGTEEVAAEGARIRATAEAERDRLLEQMRRDVDVQIRVARRTLMEEAAALATDVARERVRRQITPEDQMRLLDRYTTQLGTAR